MSCLEKCLLSAKFHTMELNFLLALGSFFLIFKC